jgi:hypothetical protein
MRKFFEKCDEVVTMTAMLAIYSELGISME